MAAIGVPITAASIDKYSSSYSSNPVHASASTSQQDTKSLANTELLPAAPVHSNIPPPSSGVTAKDLMKNPALAKLLVMAARKMKKIENQEIILK